MNVGDNFYSKAFNHKATIIDMLSPPFVLVEFNLTGNIKKMRRCNLKALQFRDYDQPTLYGIGIVGKGPVRVGGNLLRSYVAWTCLFERCQRRGNVEDQICNEWYSYNNFKSWYDTSVPEGWVVDKDYKIIGNKFYSPDHCTPLPVELNNLLTGTSTAKGYTLTRNCKFDVRVRVEGGKVVRKTFKDKSVAIQYYIDQKLLYVERLRFKYRDSVPSYVFDNAKVVFLGVAEELH